MKERLQKILSRAGIASRRKAEEMIKAGKVAVDGNIVTELGVKVDVKESKITFLNEDISLAEQYKYIMLYKPLQVLTTMKDDRGRTTVADLIKDIPERLFPVGRLDYNTDGLLLMTNNGDLAYRLTHPKYKVDKYYIVKVQKRPDEAKLNLLRYGIVLEDGMTMPARVRVLNECENIYSDAGCEIEIVIREGKKRQVRRMFDAIGHSVQSLRRVQLAFLSLGTLNNGEYRYLTGDEVLRLRRLVGL